MICSLKSSFLYGTNGAGKTNILEAIYVGTIGKSHRTNDTSDMLLFNANEAGIVVNFEKKETPQKVNIKLFRQGPKDIRLMILRFRKRN